MPGSPISEPKISIEVLPDEERGTDLPDTSEIDFDPGSLSDLLLWYDPSDSTTVTASSGLVSNLADKSGNGHDVSQAVESLKPEIGVGFIGGRNTLSFDGVDDHLRTSSSIAGASASATIFNVVLPISAGINDFATAYAFFNAAGDFGFRMIDGLFERFIPIIDAFGMNTVELEGLQFGFGIARGYAVIWDSVATREAFEVNAVEMDFFDSYTGSLPDPADLTFGATFDSTDPIQVNMGEFLFYNRVLTDTEKAQVWEYLGRWGIPISS